MLLHSFLAESEVDTFEDVFLHSRAINSKWGILRDRRASLIARFGSETLHKIPEDDVIEESLGRPGDDEEGGGLLEEERPQRPGVFDGEADLTQSDDDRDDFGDGVEDLVDEIPCDGDDDDQPPETLHDEIESQEVKGPEDSHPDLQDGSSGEILLADNDIRAVSPDTPQAAHEDVDSQLNLGVLQDDDEAVASISSLQELQEVAGPVDGEEPGQGA